MIESYQKQDGKTYYMFRIDLGYDPLTGKRKQAHRRGFKTKQQAKIAMSRLLSGIEEGSSKKITFKEVYEVWLESYKHTVKESSLNRVTQIFRLNILPVLGHYLVDKITLKEAQETVNGWFDEFVRYGMIKGYAQRVMDHAIRMGLRKENPFKLVIMPRKLKPEVDTKQNYYDREDLAAFFNAAQELLHPMWFAFFRLAAFTGARKGELLALTWSDVDLKIGTVSIKRTLTLGMGNKLIIQPPKTAKSIRTLDLDKKTVSILKNWKKLQIETYPWALKNEALLFASSDGEWLTLQRPGRALDDLFEKTNLKRITPHGFRHTHCSILFEAGADFPEVQDRLGHSDIKTTMNIYTHVSKHKKQETVDKYSAYVGF